MQCQLCDKIATVHLTEISHGEKLERHLCEECAQKEGVTIKAHVPIGELLTNLMAAQQETQEMSDMSCPQCDISWPEFRKRGQLGCPNDYIAFEEPLRKLIKRTQEGATSHVGRVPENARGGMSQQLQLLRLRQDLQRAVEAEDYETAANIRDDIDKLTTN